MNLAFEFGQSLFSPFAKATGSELVPSERESVERQVTNVGTKTENDSMMRDDVIDVNLDSCMLTQVLRGSRREKLC